MGHCVVVMRSRNSFKPVANFQITPGPGVEHSRRVPRGNRCERWKGGWEMWREGFRFSVFDPTADDYRLWALYRLLHKLDKDTLTLEQ